MEIRTDIFGMLPDGREVPRIRVSNSTGMEVSLIAFGAALQRLRMPDRNGNTGDVVLGYDSLGGYLANPNYFGVTVGRYAGRISRARFSIDGHEYYLPANDGPNHLHGGPRGLSRVLWRAETFQKDGAAGVIMGYFSPDGDEGYPEELEITVTFTLSEDNTLSFGYMAESEGPTPVSLTNHAFWNLSAPGILDIRDHQLKIFSRQYLETGEDFLPTGRRMPVGDELNFQSSRPVGDAMAHFPEGLDHCFVIDREADANPQGLHTAALLAAPDTGRRMEVLTDAPCMQFYTGNFIDYEIGLDGTEYRRHAGLCLETQAYPDSMNQPAFADSITEKDSPYRSTTIHIFRVS